MKISDLMIPFSIKSRSVLMTIFCDVTSRAEEGSSAYEHFWRKNCGDGDHRALFHAARKFKPGIFAVTSSGSPTFSKLKQASS